MAASSRTAMAWVKRGEPRSLALLRRASRSMIGSGARTHPARNPGHANLLSDPIVRIGAEGA